MPTARAATIVHCCWFCRGWTPPARAASSRTSWAAPTRWGSATPDSGRPPRRSVRTTTCGGSTTHCRRRATSGCSIARTMRTCSSCGFMIWCPATSGKAATTRLTPSRKNSSSRAPQWSRWRCSSRSMSRSADWPSGSTGPTGTGSTTRAILTSANSGPPTRRPIRRYWIEPRRTMRRGTWCPAIRSGTANWPSPNFSSKRSQL